MKLILLLTKFKYNFISFFSSLRIISSTNPQPPTNIPEPQINIPQPPTNIPKPPTSIPQPPINIPKPLTNIPQSHPNILKPLTNISQPPTNIPKPPTNIPKLPSNILKPPTILVVISNGKGQVPKAPFIHVNNTNVLKQSPTHPKKSKSLSFSGELTKKKNA